MSDAPSFLEPEQPAVIEAPQEALETEGQGEPPPAPAPEPAAPPAVSEPREDGRIPIAAMLDEREKRQAAQREAEDLRRKLAAYEAQKAQPAPDFYDDPEARLQAERAQVHNALWNERLNTSELVARQAHGEETVNAAREAFMSEAQQNPALAVELRRQQHPYDFVVNWHRRQRVLAEVGTDPAAYRAKIETEVRERVLAELAAAQPQKPAAPPPSLAAAPSVGSNSQAIPSPFENLFGA